MIELYGFPISNFYNKVKLALLEKDINFTEKRAAPSRTNPDVLKFSPMGKIPWIIHDSNVLFESTVIVEYLEDAFPATNALLPKSPQKRARVRMIMSIIDLHIDPPARKMFDLLIDKKVDPEVCKKATESMEFAIAALAKIAHFDPFIAGSEFTLADCSAIATLLLANDLYKKLERENPLLAIRGYTSYLEQINARESTKKVLRSLKAARRGLGYSN